MGTLIFWAGTLLGVFLGIVLISLLTMARKGGEVFDSMTGGDTIATRSGTYCLPASETPSPISCHEMRPQGDLSGSVEAH